MCGFDWSATEVVLQCAKFIKAKKVGSNEVSLGLTAFDNEDGGGLAHLVGTAVGGYFGGAALAKFKGKSWSQAKKAGMIQGFKSGVGSLQPAKYNFKPTWKKGTNDWNTKLFPPANRPLMTNIHRSTVKTPADECLRKDAVTDEDNEPQIRGTGTGTGTGSGTGSGTGRTSPAPGEGQTNTGSSVQSDFVCLLLLLLAGGAVLFT